MSTRCLRVGGSALIVLADFAALVQAKASQAAKPSAWITYMFGSTSSHVGSRGGRSGSALPPVAAAGDACFTSGAGVGRCGGAPATPSPGPADREGVRRQEGLHIAEGHPGQRWKRGAVRAQPSALDDAFPMASRQSSGHGHANRRARCLPGGLRGPPHQFHPVQDAG